MNVKSFLGGFDKNLCYLIWCNESKEAAIIDPSVEISPILETIESNKLQLRKIIITHTHHDHIQYLQDFIYYYPLLKIIGHPQPLKKMGEAYQGVDNHENIALGKTMLTTIHTPGHYSDSICIWNLKSEILFTGDTMFVGRTGRTISENSNIKHLYNSVYSRILTLPGDTLICPGHHYGFTREIILKENINLSKFFQCSSLDEFKVVMSLFEKNRRG
jgi:glyoxylase-like metal-dependent hydrolase (beta-lactamase superfamily II)